MPRPKEPAGQRALRLMLVIKQQGEATMVSIAEAERVSNYIVFYTLKLLQEKTNWLHVERRRVPDTNAYAHYIRLTDVGLEALENGTDFMPPSEHKPCRVTPPEQKDARVLSVLKALDELGGAAPIRQIAQHLEMTLPMLRKCVFEVVDESDWLRMDKRRSKGNEHLWVTLTSAGRYVLMSGIPKQKYQAEPLPPRTSIPLVNSVFALAERELNINRYATTSGVQTEWRTIA